MHRVEVGHSLAGGFDEAIRGKFPDVVGLRFRMIIAARNGATMDRIGGRELAVAFVQRFDFLGHLLQ